MNYFWATVNRVSAFSMLLIAIWDSRILFVIGSLCLAGVFWNLADSEMAKARSGK